MELNEKKLKSILTDQRKEYQRFASQERKEYQRYLHQERKEYQRYLGVLKEDFESQVKLIAESVIGIQKQLIAIRDMVIKNTEDIGIIRMDIGIIKSDLKEKVDRDEFEALGKRVAILEAKLQQG